MNNLTKRILTSVVLLSLIYFSIMYSLFLLLFLTAIYFFAFKEISFIYKRIFNKNFFFIFIANLLSVTYLFIFVFIVWINLGSSNIEKITSLIFLFLICIFTDTGGFIFGKIIGGKKLTKISPNKTYSGVIGSFLFSLTFGYLFYIFQKNVLIFEINVFLMIFIVSLLSQIGDLTISLLKRKANVKESGSLLPGHGGILDRIDGILMAIPFGILLISL